MSDWRAPKPQFSLAAAAEAARKAMGGSDG